MGHDSSALVVDVTNRRARMPSNAEEKVLSYGDVLLRRQDVYLLTGPNWLNDQVCKLNNLLP